MIKVNLLPVREWKRREQARQQVSVFFLSLIFLVLLGVAATIALQGKLITLRKEAENLNQQKARLAYVNKAINDAENKRTAITEKFQAIENLQKGRTMAIEVLDEVASNIPIDRLWLTNLSLKGDSLNLKGSAMDNHTVALFMRRLQASKMFKSVDLTDIQRTIQARSKMSPSQSDQELMNFSLKIVIASLTKKQVKKG